MSDLTTYFRLPLAIALVSLSGGSLASAQTAEELLIKARSAYQQPSDARNPFVPIGWVKPTALDVGPGAGGAAPRIDRALALFKAERFLVTSISTGALPLALINGKPYGEGDLIPLGEHESAQVMRIRDGEVHLRFRDQSIKLTIKRSDERLLNR